MPTPSSADRHVTHTQPSGANPLHWRSKDPVVDDPAIVADRSSKRATAAYEHMQGFRRKLPVWDHQEALLRAIAQHQVVVVSGETGVCSNALFLLQHIESTLDGSYCIAQHPILL
jgi:HrpA-like RNA helicase